MNKKSKTIFFPIEIKTRELLPKLYLVNKSLNEGFNCFIGDKIGINRALNYFSPGTYFYKSINVFDNLRIKNIISKGNHYVALDEEGGFAFDKASDLEKFINLRSSYENMKIIDLFFNWGNFDFQTYRKIYPKFKDKFKLTGGPKINLWKKELLNRIYKREINYIKNKYGKDFIFITGSSWSNKIEALKSFRLSTRNYKFKNNKEKEGRIKHIHKEIVDFKSFGEMIKYLIKVNPKKKFIIRPHPAEKVKDWEKILNNKKFDNYSIIKKFDTTPWVYLSSQLIHNKSSVVFEAIMLKKKVISFRPRISSRDFVNKFGYVAKNKFQVNKFLSKKFDSLVISKKMKKELNYKLLNSNKKENACDNILDNIKKIHKSENSYSIFKVYLFSLLFLIYDKINSFFGLKKLDSKLKKQLDNKLKGGIKKNEILNYLNSIKKNNYKVIRISTNSYFIYV